MRKIEIPAGTHIKDAVRMLKEKALIYGEECCGEFVGVTIYSTDSEDDAYNKLNERETNEQKVFSLPAGAQRGFDPALMSIFGKPIESKATALQYALDSTATYENGQKVLHTDKAKEIFDFICENVNLPDVPLSEFLGELNKTLDAYRKKAEERNAECN